MRRRHESSFKSKEEEKSFNEIRHAIHNFIPSSQVTYILRLSTFQSTTRKKNDIYDAPEMVLGSVDSGIVIRHAISVRYVTILLPLSNSLIFLEILSWNIQNSITPTMQASSLNSLIFSQQFLSFTLFQFPSLVCCKQKNLQFDIYIYIYIYRERERVSEKEREREKAWNYIYIYIYIYITDQVTVHLYILTFFSEV